MQSFDIRLITLETSVNLVSSPTSLADHAFQTVNRSESRVIGRNDALTIMTLYNDGRVYISGRSFDELLDNRAVVSDRLQTDGLTTTSIGEGQIVTGLLDFEEPIEPRVLTKIKEASLSSNTHGTTIEYAGNVNIKLHFVGIDSLVSLDTGGTVSDVRASLKQFDKAYTEARTQ